MAPRDIFEARPRFAFASANVERCHSSSTWKLVVWDKLLGPWTGGMTDALSGGMETLIVTVAAAYFGGRTIESVARIIRKGK